MHLNYHSIYHKVLANTDYLCTHGQLIMTAHHQKIKKNTPESLSRSIDWVNYPLSRTSFLEMKTSVCSVKPLTANISGWRRWYKVEKRSLSQITWWYFAVLYIYNAIAMLCHCCAPMFQLLYAWKSSRLDWSEASREFGQCNSESLSRNPQTQVFHAWDKNWSRNGNINTSRLSEHQSF